MLFSNTSSQPRGSCSLLLPGPNPLNRSGSILPRGHPHHKTSKRLNWCWVVVSKEAFARNAAFEPKREFQRSFAKTLESVSWSGTQKNLLCCWRRLGITPSLNSILPSREFVAALAGARMERINSFPRGEAPSSSWEFTPASSQRSPTSVGFLI